MPQTLAEKIMSRLAGRTVAAGDFIDISPDWTFSIDDGIGLVDRYFRLNGVSKLAAPEKIAVFYDHFSPADSPLHAEVQRIGRQLCAKFGITRLYEVGEGISHQIAVETGLVRPGEMIVNTDSHTVTLGAVGAIGTGIGVAEMAYLWAHGSLWFRVPASRRITLHGRLGPTASAKDLALVLLKTLTARGAIYESIEFHGLGLHQLGIPERLTLCNMGMELGAKFTVCPADDVTIAHYAALGIDIADALHPDKDAHYVDDLEIDLASIEPMVAIPHQTDNVEPVRGLGLVTIHQAFLGTCTNGRFEDFAEAAAILKGRKLAPGVRMIVTPASKVVFKRALSAGFIDTFVDAGCVVTTPGCGACAGIHQGVLAADEVCIASSNRNFIGRMGHADARIYLASPATVAASAVAGRISSPHELSELSPDSARAVELY
jgi:homoaconitate hydratase family protein